MKKRIIAILMALVLCFALSACGEPDPIVGTYSEGWAQKDVNEYGGNYLGAFEGDYYFTDTTFVFNEDGTVDITVLSSSYNMIADETYMIAAGDYGRTYHGTWEKTDTIDSVNPEGSGIYEEERVLYQIYQDDHPVFKVWFLENPEELIPEIVAEFDYGSDYTYMTLGRDVE